MLLGLHCPTLKGYELALSRAVELECEAMQILPYRRHQDPEDENYSAFRERRAASAVKKLFVHSRFVPSLASSDERRRNRSIELLTTELELAARWGADAYVLHAGAYSPEYSKEEGLALVAAAIAAAYSRVTSQTPLLMENVPGGGRRLGGTLEELGALLDLLAAKNVRAQACLDTAHAWAAGYELATAEGMLKFLSRAHRLLGGRVAAFHLNDTRAKLGSNLENHEHWGQGFLGKEGLRALLSREEFADAVGIIEPPRAGQRDAESLSFARGLRA